jgi:site-specific DNA-methyltransferase (adenine-specific)
MGKEWDGWESPASFQRWCQAWATECLRVLKPGGFLLAFGGTRTWHRLTCGIEDAGFEDAGFEIRDSTASVTGQDAPQLGRWPANVVFTHSAGCEKTGTRQVRSDSHHPASRGPGGLGTSGHGGQEGFTERSPRTETVETWACADGCPVAELDWQSAGTRAAKPSKTGGAGSGGASRFFPAFRWQAKAPSSERPRLAEGTAHPTVKPVALMRWLVQLVTPPGGVVLDPFAGTGTTGEACIIGGFRCVLIDNDPSSAELVRARLSKPIQPDLFARGEPAGGAA